MDKNMITQQNECLSAKNLFIIVTIAVLITDLAVLLDISFLRQIFGFLFLTILPGLLILQILKLNKIGYTEKLVLVVGLSIFFLMFFGLFLNGLSLSLGHETPLSTISLLIAFNLTFIVLAIIGHKLNKTQSFSMPNLNLTTSERAFLIVPVLFPALSIFGMHIMNTTDNNVVLMFLLFLIPIYVAFVCFFNQKFPKRIYPVVIFLISISLLLIWMLRFSHIFGSDVHVEYYLSRLVLNNLHWSIIELTALDACLSITLLPAIYQSVLNPNAQEYLFRGVYTLICSFGPLAIYVISKKYVGELYAFLASFFFMSQPTFLCAPISPRTNVAIFFVALAVMVFFSDKINPLKRRFLFIVFMLSIVVSHYSTTYTFFFIMFFSWFVVEIFSKMHSFKKSITLTTVLVFFSFIFLWYSQVTEAAFDSGIFFIKSTFSNLNNFFVEELRDPSLEGLYGKGILSQGLTYPILSRVNWVVTWCTFIFIGIGVLTIIKRNKEMTTISNVKLKNPDFLKDKFEMEYLTMAVACVGVLVAMVVLPFVSHGYGIQRVYSLAVIILSVCFVIGGMRLSKHFSFFTKHFLSKERTCAKKETLFAKQKAFMEKCYRSSSGKAFLFKKRFVLKEKNNSFFGRAFFSKERFKGKNALQNPVRKSVGTKNSSEVRVYLIILLILIPYFLFQTGAMYQICGVPFSITLNSGGVHKEQHDIQYVPDQESCTAKWLKNYAEKNARVYTTDRPTSKKLISQGEFSKKSLDFRSFSARREIKGYLYLSYNNVVNERFPHREGIFNMSDYTDMFIGMNEIYDSGVSEIYRLVTDDK